MGTSSMCNANIKNNDNDDNLKNNNKQTKKLNITINSGGDSQFWGGEGFPVFSLQRVLVFSFHILFLPAALWRRGRGGRKKKKEEEQEEGEEEVEEEEMI